MVNSNTSGYHHFDLSATEFGDALTDRCHRPHLRLPVTCGVFVMDVVLPLAMNMCVYVWVCVCVCGVCVCP